MKLWIKKFLEQAEFGDEPANGRANLSEESGTILFLLDAYSRHLFDLEGHPLRRAREEFQQFARDLLSTDKSSQESTLFRFRQYFANYRAAEFANVQKSFENLKAIIWSFIEQSGEDSSEEQSGDRELNSSLEALRAALENESPENLRAVCTEFIQAYMTHQAKKDHRRMKRMRMIRQSLAEMRTFTGVPDRNLKVDADTQLSNRLSFDEHLRHRVALQQMEKGPACLLLIEIDQLDELSQTYGEDFALLTIQECARIFRAGFNRDQDFVARTGKASFAVVAGKQTLALAAQRAEAILTRIRGEIFAKDSIEWRFTVSIGLSQYQDGESSSGWTERTTNALLASKSRGNDRLTFASFDEHAA